MACRLFGVKPLSNPMLGYNWIKYTLVMTPRNIHYPQKPTPTPTPTSLHPQCCLLCVAAFGRHWSNHYLNRWQLLANHTPRARLQWKSVETTHFQLKKLHLKCSPVIVLLHNGFSPGGEQPEQRVLAHTSRCDNQLPVVWQYFKISLLSQTWSYYNLGCITDVSNATMRVYGAWIKRRCLLCSKTYNTMSNRL